jgi:hypothetical protein
MDILQEKRFPENFPDDVLRIIRTLAFDMDGVEVMGSQRLRSQLYSADYDLYEVVESNLKHDGLALQKFVLRFQEKIRQLTRMNGVYITDIKAGLLRELEIIPEESYVVGNTFKNFNRESALMNAECVYDRGAISKDEFDEIVKRIHDMRTADDFLTLKKDLRFHIVRWTPSAVEANQIRTPSGPMSLQYAFCCPTIVKLDVIAYLESAGKYVEFSIIYQFKNGRKVFNRFTMDAQREIRQNLLYLASQGNWFKVAKRMFSLAKINDWERDLEGLNAILNSDLGILYSLVSDAETILFLLENEPAMPVTKIRYTLQGFRERLGNVYSAKANQPSILRDILRMEHLPATADGRVKLYDQMVRLIDFFSVLLNKHAEEALQKEGFVPIDPKYKPGYAEHS